MELYLSKLAAPAEITKHGETTEPRTGGGRRREEQTRLIIIVGRAVLFTRHGETSFHSVGGRG